MARWTVRQGRTIRKKVTLRYSRNDPEGNYLAGDPITGVFTGEEPLSMEIYTGDMQAPLDMDDSYIEWIDGTEGTVRIAIVPGETLPAVYRLVASVETDGEIRDFLETQVEVLGAPDAGSAALKVYASFDDCVNVCPFLPDLITTNPSMQSDIAEQRADGRTWWDDLCHVHSPTGSSMAYNGSLNWGNPSARNTWLQEQLDANRMNLTRPIRRANALYAVALVMESLVGQGGDKDYQALASRYRMDAENLAKSITVEIDTNDDGRYDIAINLSYLPVING